MPERVTALSRHPVGRTSPGRKSRRARGSPRWPRRAAIRPRGHRATANVGPNASFGRARDIGAMRRERERHRSPPREARVACFVQPRDHPAHPQEGQGDRQAGKERAPGGRADELLHVVQQRAPADDVAVAQAEEAERRLRHDRAPGRMWRTGIAGPRPPTARTWPRSSRAVPGQRVSPSRRTIGQRRLPSRATVTSTRKKRGITWQSSASRISASSTSPPA